VRRRVSFWSALHYIVLVASFPHSIKLSYEYNIYKCKSVSLVIKNHLYQYVLIIEIGSSSIRSKKKPGGDEREN